MALTEVMAGIDVRTELPDIAVAGLTHDSRQVAAGFVFLALPGLTTDGKNFIPQAVALGAAAIVGATTDIEGGDTAGGDIDTGPVPYIPVANPKGAYSRMAANFYGHPSRSMTTVGITGTNGKTTTTVLVAAILEAAGIPAATLGTLGVKWNGKTLHTGFTTPEAGLLQSLLADLKNAGRKGVVMEISSHALHQERSADVDFDVALFTNLTPEHLDYHGSMAAYQEAKLRLFRQLTPDGTAIVNLDDPAAENFMAAAPGRVLTYGLDPAADLQVTNFGLNLERTVAGLRFGEQSFAIESRLVGSYNLMNILGAALAGLALNLPVETIRQGIADVETVPGRLERISSVAPGIVMIDYAHTPDAYSKVLGTLQDLTPAETRLVLMFGCGGDRDRAKRPEMARIAEHYAERVIITSDNPRTEPLEQINADILAGFSGQRHSVIPDRSEALHTALGEMTPDTVLLILGKGRENYELIGTEKVHHDDVAIIENYKA